ncbi:hypothetical protein D3C76_1233080 [compost metagenome]
MNRVETRAQYFITTIKMMQIGTRIIATGIAIALGIKRAGIAFMLRITDFYHAVGHEQVTITGVAGRHNAVEHINAATHAFNQIFWFADAHQVTRFICRNLWANMFQNTVHVFFRFTHSQTADSVAIKTYLYQTFNRDIA